MNHLTVYDCLNRPELRILIKKRKLKVYMNSSGLQFRLALIKDDIENGRDPFIKNDHNNLSVSDDGNPLQR